MANWSILLLNNKPLISVLDINFTFASPTDNQKVMHYYISLVIQNIAVVVSDSFTIPRTIACRVPLSMGFPRLEYWSGLPFPPPGNFPNPGIKPGSPVSLVLAGGFFTTELPAKPSPQLNHVLKRQLPVGSRAPPPHSCSCAEVFQLPCFHNLISHHSFHTRLT